MSEPIDILAVVHEHRITELEKAYGEVNITLRSIDSTLRTITGIQADQQRAKDDINRAFSELRDVCVAAEDLEERVTDMEKQMPMLELTKRWVISGVLAVVAAAWLAAIKFWLW